LSAQIDDNFEAFFENTCPLDIESACWFPDGSNDRHAVPAVAVLATPVGMNVTSSFAPFFMRFNYDELSIMLTRAIRVLIGTYIKSIDGASIFFLICKK